MEATITELTIRLRARKELPPPPICRVIRTTAGASLRDVASIVGVTRQAVGLWEAGARTPRGENLQRYLDVLRALRDEVSTT